VADVLALYARDVAKDHARPKAASQRIGKLLDFFGERGSTLADVSGALCREYAAARGSDSAARNELTDLRSAVNHHRKEGLCAQKVEVLLPPARPGRERWLTKPEAAAVIAYNWRYRETQFGVVTVRRPRRHVAKFVLVALYTGTRAALVCGAALQPTPGHGWVDLDSGLFHRRPPGAKVTNKRAPPIPLPDRLLVHMRRWKRLGQTFVVEHNGNPVKRVSKAFRRSADDLGFTDVVPHTLRHTAATWMMQAGVDAWEAAGYLGMSVKTLLDRYGHHHPSHLAQAKNAFQKLRIVGHNVGPKSGPES